jgi:hypothetical protein
MPKVQKKCRQLGRKSRELKIGEKIEAPATRSIVREKLGPNIYRNTKMSAFLKNLPVKVIGGRVFICLMPPPLLGVVLIKYVVYNSCICSPHNPIPFPRTLLHSLCIHITYYYYLFTQGRGGGGGGRSKVN